MDDQLRLQEQIFFTHRKAACERQGSASYCVGLDSLSREIPTEHFPEASGEQLGTGTPLTTNESGWPLASRF